MTTLKEDHDRLVHGGIVHDWHNPHAFVPQATDFCPHNLDYRQDCTCKRPRIRKPFKVVRVKDPSHGYNTKEDIVMEIYPNGVLYFREARCKTRFQTTTATIYEDLRRREALKIARAKKVARRAR